MIIVAACVITAHQFSDVHLSELVQDHLKTVGFWEVNAGKVEPQLISICLFWQLFKDNELNPF